ncbi:sarcosine oxidase subunit alpha family protein [Aquibaculum sediminis]|uniref:sarcosine oxidase subunit alpha family protein n=1 Tax=Aquibaculum sediminis TaxID=3231907 RepID=UPI0034536ABD
MSAAKANKSQRHRSADGGRIDRGTPLSFRFDGQSYQGYAGDTLASALLANGVTLVGRSFKYHRPRGILSAGVEEPNALVQLRSSARHEPNVRATVAELYDGLEATSQNRWPSLTFDVSSINNAFSAFLGAGFYYKTFMGPTRGAWHFYERIIRKAAGLGTAPTLPDPDRYEKAHAHCDLLIVGGGAAGLAAALAAGRSGARVFLVEQDNELGGALLGEAAGARLEWATAAAGELASLPNVRILTRTTAFGFYDHGVLGLVERVADHLPQPGAHQPRQRLWTLRTKQVVIAAGAHERPLVFGDNDIPGVMLAGAVRRYLHRWAVTPGERATVFANHDEAYRTALDLADAGIAVAAVVDPRPVPGGDLLRALAERGIEHLGNHVVVRARGGRHLLGAEVAALDADAKPSEPTRFIPSDLLAMSGGWNPAVQLHAQSGGKPQWDSRLFTFVPGTSKQAERSAGAAAGHMTLASALADGVSAAGAALEALGHTPKPIDLPAVEPEAEAVPAPLWEVYTRKGKRFVDFQHDVTAKDLDQAVREGYRAPEHAKRYTTLGMATDQGKTANVNALEVLARARGEAREKLAQTTFRPPYTPVSLGAFGGRDVLRHYHPIRRTPMHVWHEAQGAVMVETGLWMRPRYYPRGNETLFEAMNRETKHVREKVGMVDVSTLGKIDVQGPDAGEFLNRIYANGFKKLPVGKARYGVMLREDGMVFDDGTCSRLSENHYLVTTTTANAARILSHMEYHLQTNWPDLRVHVASVTDQIAAMAIAGPQSRAVLQKAVEGADVSSEALPFMGVVHARIAGKPVIIFRISFSGELAYEVAAGADHGLAVWEALMEAGQESEIIAYGTEAMAVMRIEKGHAAGPELSGQTTAADLGLGKLCSTKKPYIGHRLKERPATADPHRPALVGLVSIEDNKRIPGGAQLVEDPQAKAPVPMLGYATSPTYSITLNKNIALGLLKDGAERMGTTLYATNPLNNTTVKVEVVSPHFFDPEGKRLHA